MTLELAWPWMLAVLPLPLLMALVLPAVPREPVAALRIPFFTAVAGGLARGAQRSWWRVLLAVLAWLLLVLAACRPQFVGDPIRLPVSGRDLLLAVDISGSMQTQDMVEGRRVIDRLTAVKRVAGEFIGRRQGDRLGLILFGQQAYLQTPLTFDRKTVRQLLDEAAIGLAGRATAIGDAIGLAVKRLREQTQDNRVLILLTDGANTAGEIEPLKAAQLAAQSDIRIYTIGIGADEVMMRDVFGGRRRVNPSSDLDEETLLAIADLTGGQYFRGRDIQALQEIYALLDALEPLEVEEDTFRPVRDLYHWPLAGALLLSLVLAASHVSWILSASARASRDSWQRLQA